MRTDTTLQTNRVYLVRAEAVPDQDPQRDYSTPGNILAKDLFTTCLLTVLCKAALEPVNSEKLQESIQDKQENLSQFLEDLTKAHLYYTSLDSKTQMNNSLWPLASPQIPLTLEPSLSLWREDP